MTDIPTGDLVAAIVARARQYGAREIRIGGDGAFLTDAAGRNVRLEFRPDVPFDADAILAYLENRDQRSGISMRQSWREPDNMRWIDNAAYLLSVKEGAATLKAKKAPKAALEQLADFDPSDLARLRSLYGQPGIAIHLDIEGETRGHEMLAAIAGELRQVGLGVEAALRPPGPSYSREPDTLPDVFPEEPAAWRFGLSHRPLTPVPAGEATSVSLRVDGRRVYYGDPSPRVAYDIEGDRLVAVKVSIRNSRPVAKVSFSPPALAMTRTDNVYPDAPWLQVLARAAARGAVTRPPKTWHTTTFGVAEAYVRQEAPRGYVSSKSVYFHGPVAYSEYDSHPIAAMVEREDGGTAILLGYNRGKGRNGVAASMQGEIRQAALDKDFAFIAVDDLRDIVMVGGMPLPAFAGRRRADKAEQDHPARCSVEFEACAAWLREIVAAGEETVEEAFTGAPWPTLRKVRAYDAILRAETVRLQFRDILGIDLPPACDAAAVTARRDEIQRGYDERQAELAAKRERVEAGDDVPPGP